MEQEPAEPGSAPPLKARPAQRRITIELPDDGKEEDSEFHIHSNDAAGAAPQKLLRMPTKAETKSFLTPQASKNQPMEMEDTFGKCL